MKTYIIDSQADFDRMYEELVVEFKKINWMPHFAGEHKKLAAIHRKYFETGVDPNGKTWPPLTSGKPSYLTDTKRLRFSLGRAGGTQDSVREMVNEPAGRGYSFGTAVPYSLFHIFGTSRLPRRDHIGFNTMYLSDAADRTLDYAIGELSS